MECHISISYKQRLLNYPDNDWSRTSTNNELKQHYDYLSRGIYLFYCLPLSSLFKSAHGHWPHVTVCRVSCGGVFNMLLVLSPTFHFHNNIWGCTCSTGPFQYRWLKGFICSSCYRHQIGSIHFSHCCHIFPWLCVWDCIYIPGKPGICLHYYCAVYDECNWSDTFWLGRSFSFICTLHHLIIIIMQTYLKTLNL